MRNRSHELPNQQRRVRRRVVMIEHSRALDVVVERGLQVFLHQWQERWNECVGAEGEHFEGD